VLCDLAESGDLRNVLPLSHELAFRFYSYWNIVAGRRSLRPDIRLPFDHLSGDGIWSALYERGEPSPDKKLAKCARLPSDLVAFLEDPADRDRARHLLIAKYSRLSEQISLYEMAGLPTPTQHKIELDAAHKSPE
jgi:putative restriction endonuclease